MDLTCLSGSVNFLYTPSILLMNWNCHFAQRHQLYCCLLIALVIGRSFDQENLLAHVISDNQLACIMSNNLVAL